MNDDEIKDNPSLSKLIKNAEDLKIFQEAWPLLRGFIKNLGVDTVRIDQHLESATELVKNIHEMTAIPDKFNDIFSGTGWILFDRMSLDIAKQAIDLAETEGIERADEFLADYFSPDWVEKNIIVLKFLKGFKERFDIAQLALEDYKAGRYYASVLVTLSLIDGWIGELNFIDFNRHGFFSDKSQLVAWDSIAAHPKGLVKLKEVFGIGRMRTRVEEIRIPYRHGIVHGMDLGYNNKYVAAKCWAALFAIRDWAIKTTRDELNPPELEPEVEKTLWESIESFERVQRERELFKRWQPREIIVGESIPPFGEPNEYTPNTPERNLVEFLHYWLKSNYGYMAKCFSPIVQMKPISVRNSFQNLKLIECALVSIKEIMPTIADVRVNVKFENQGELKTSEYEFRTVCTKPNGDWANIQDTNTVWGISTWRTVQ